MTYFRLFYVTLSVPDMVEAVKWYEEKLGFKLVKQKNFAAFGTRIGVVERDYFRVELVEQKNSIPMPVPRPTPPAHTYIQGISQFAFYTDDLDAMCAELESRGVELVWDKQVDPNLELSFQFIRDNNGNLIQFVELMK